MLSRHTKEERERGGGRERDQAGERASERERDQGGERERERERCFIDNQGVTKGR
jgi:hypothetical protein